MMLHSDSEVTPLLRDRR